MESDQLLIGNTQLLNQNLLESAWPDANRKLNLFEAIEQFDNKKLASELKNLLAIHAAQSEMLRRPIVGVLGELNSGKSSVVSSFLSAAGRARLPRGEENSKGTHRFVYWLPASWSEENEVQSACYELLAKTHGNSKEMLSEDITKAEQQYRSGRDDLERLGTPLIANDPQLDSISVAFLDCPDVQTKDGADESSSENPRLDFIRKSANLCSAFLLVWEKSKLRDKMLKAILECVREQMPGVPLYLLINKIGPEPNQPLATIDGEEVRSLINEFKINRCYVAFDFRIYPRNGKPGWEELTPTTLVEKFHEISKNDGVELPQFFSVLKNSDADIHVDSLEPLGNLWMELTPGRMQAAKQQDNSNGLNGKIEEAVSFIESECDTCSARVKEVHRELLKFCAKRFQNNVGEAKQLLTPEYSEAFLRSFQRTAPFVTKWILKTTKPIDFLTVKVSRGFQSAWRGTKQAKEVILSLLKDGPKGPMKQTVEEKMINAGVADARIEDAEELAREMHSKRWVPRRIQVEDLKDSWETVIKNLKSNRLSHDSEDEKGRLDGVTRELWKSLTRWQRVKLTSISLAKTLAGITVIASASVAVIDGGATFMATSSVAGSIAGSVAGVLPGLVSAGVAAGSVGVLASVYSITLKQNTLPYLARYFALACDAFGVPRQLGDQPNRVQFKLGVRTETCELPDPELPPTKVECEIEKFMLWSVNERVASEIRKEFCHASSNQ